MSDYPVTTITIVIPNVGNAVDIVDKIEEVLDGYNDNDWGIFTSVREEE